MKVTYPKEFYIKLTDNQHLLGRVIVSQTHKGFMAELDLVLKDSRKIFKHVGIFSSNEHEQEVLQEAFIRFKKYFEKLS